MPLELREPRRPRDLRVARHLRVEQEIEVAVQAEAGEARHRVHLALDAGLRERDIREPENLLDDASPRGARLGAASPAAASSSP
ncbi:MAG: hypothetical protein ACYDCK_01755, partial [Thermoplasmatota archaeon]